MARPRKRILSPLEPDSPLCFILESLGSRYPDVFISRRLAEQWPENEFLALQNIGLVKASSARTVNCHQCEYLCRELETIYHHNRRRIVCPCRDDICYIDIEDEDLEQYRFSMDSLKEFIIRELNCRPYIHPENDPFREDANILGIASSGKVRLIVSMGCSQIDGCYLQVADNKEKIRDILGFDGNAYRILPHLKEVLLCTEKNTEPIIHRNARWLAEVDYRKENRTHYPSGIYEQLSREEGVSANYIKNQLKTARGDRATLQLKIRYLEQLRKERG